jgi:hypothetical protein
MGCCGQQTWFCQDLWQAPGDVGHAGTEGVRMDPKAAEERFFKSLTSWPDGQSQGAERLLDAATDVDAAVERMFEELLGRRSIPPR